MPNFIDKDDISEDVVDAAREARFLEMLELAYHDLYSVGLAVVGNRHDADDVIQEVCVVIWRKFDEFEEGTNFKKWATSVTFNVAKTVARNRRRRQGFGLSDHALSRVAQMTSSGSELYELQCEILEECLERLPPPERNFLSICYRDSFSPLKYAREQGISVETIHTRLKRLRRRLSDCMTRRLGRTD